ncbi:baseplate J/gp47 family protein [Campylobacter sputorum]|uniref:baseplate J/gp47 family protein n=1 Tax=Campylobacter sputorum TaxID=206 RepID=UPI00053BE78F|nr:baseplate J/gp47 family protein [Campylobacter sputorum]
MKLPNFIQPLDIDKERNEIIQEFKQKSSKLDYIPLIGDDYITLIDIFLYRINNKIQEINFKIANNYLNFSSGEYLDELVALIGIKRHKAVKPIATIKISVNSPTFLARGTKLIDTKGHNAYFLKDVLIQGEATAKIELDVYTDEQYQTTILEVPNIYVKSIEIIEPFTGFKAKESDAELLNRYLLSLHRFSTAGSKKSYLFYVLNIEGIKRANVYMLSPGVVQIIHFSYFANDVAQIKIREALVDDRVPLTDKIEIKPANRIKLDLNIEITLFKDFMFSEVLTNATKKLNEYFDTLDIGFTPHSSKLIDVAFDENVKSVEVKTQIPLIDRDSILILNSLTITKAQNV